MSKTRLMIVFIFSLILLGCEERKLNDLEAAAIILLDCEKDNKYNPDCSEGTRKYFEEKMLECKRAGATKLQVGATIEEANLKYQAKSLWVQWHVFWYAIPNWIEWIGVGMLVLWCLTLD